MRAYFFNNMYLSSIQNGIQAGHAAVELMMKYTVDPMHENGKEQAGMVLDWAEQHKTFVVLNGGGTPTMHELRSHLESPFNELPWAQFIEPDLDGALTSLVILLPERLYGDFAQMLTKSTLEAERNNRIPPDFSKFDFTEWEMKFLLMKARCHLAL
jgi:hypothetical protein